MGKKQTGIFQAADGRWEVDKYIDRVRFRQRFDSFEDAHAWLTRILEEQRQRRVHGIAPAFTFNQAAGRFLLDHQHLASIESYGYHLKAVMPFIQTLTLEQIHAGTLQPFIDARLRDGASHKTINLTLAAVRRILNLASRSWRDEATGKPWLVAAPMIPMLPLAGKQRPPRPISWDEREKLLSELPAHLREMALFVLNTGVRDDVVCNLKWDWELPIPELGISVFETPAENVKGRRMTKLVVCNSVAQSVIERARNAHPTHVFAMQWRHHPLGPIRTMNNSAWQSARKRAGLPDLHVHDLRHTTGMLLREAGVAQVTIRDILWHSGSTITDHYTTGQIKELHAALEKITTPSNKWNKSIQSLRAEAAARRQNGVNSRQLASEPQGR